MMAKHKLPPPSAAPMVSTDMVAVPATPKPHPAPALAAMDDPERPTSIPPTVWGMLRRYAHLIAVEEPQLRRMLADAPGDTPVADALERKGQEIDALRAQIVTLADVPARHA